MGIDKDVEAKINDILSSIKNSKESEKNNCDVKVKNIKRPEIPRGKPKSGRIWKSTKEKFSTIKKSKGAHMKFKQKEEERIRLKLIKEASKEIQKQKEEEKQAKKQRRRENLKKAEEKRIKSEIVQIISNPAKLKRMKKKQLRFIEKRDTTVVSK